LAIKACEVQYSCKKILSSRVNNYCEL